MAWEGRIRPPGFSHLSLAYITLGSIVCKTFGKKRTFINVIFIKGTLFNNLRW